MKSEYRKMRKYGNGEYFYLMSYVLTLNFRKYGRITMCPYGCHFQDTSRCVPTGATFDF